MKVARAISSSVFLAALIASGQTPSAADEKVKLTGCLIRGAGDGAGYLLVNVPADPAQLSTNPAPVAPGAVGTTGTYANLFYWLDKEDDLQPHVGHQVEIEGEFKDAIRDGEIKIDRKAEWTEIEVKSDGRTMKAQVPNSSIVAAPDADRRVNVLVRRVDVDKVRMLSANCR